jgi:hypothetical protein
LFTCFQKVLNKLKRQTFSWNKIQAPAKVRSRKGQVAVILMLVIAAALIFYAVSLNVGKLSNTKTLTTMASNMGASKMASQMASYGQVLFMETLGGKKRVCGLTGIASALVSIVVTVVCIIVIATSYGSGTTAVTAFWTAVVGLALSVVSLVLQITYIQPGITEMWNKITAETLEMADQFVENGVRAGLQQVVTDPKMIPDIDDLDADTIFGFEDSDGDGQYKALDEYSRYAFYYTERLKAIEMMDTSIMEAFQDALRDFVYEDVNTDWGIYDPAVDFTQDPPVCAVNCCYMSPGTQVYSYCNPCCLPDQIQDPTDMEAPYDMLDIRPSCCDTGEASECGISATCTNPNWSPFLGGAAGDFPWVADEYAENYDNTFVSFMEALGWDDEHTGYRRDMTGAIAGDPLTLPDEYEDGIPQIDDTALNDFRIEDTIGFANLDGKPGIFSYFWKLMDWGTDLNNVTRQCQWCDEDGGPSMVCPVDHPPLWEEPQLTLPSDPTTLQFDISYCVDNLSDNQAGNFDNGLGRTFPYPPVAVDIIEVPPNVLAEDDQCAQNIFQYNSSDIAEEQELVGFWKPGADRYCNRTVSGDPTANSMTWPYEGACPGHGTYPDPEYGYPINCTCEDAGSSGCGPASNFHADVLDDMVYGLPEFVEWADSILAYTPQRLARDFVAWYPDAADWIEPPAPPATDSTDPPCYLCEETDDDGNVIGPHVGYLWVWQAEMEVISERIDRWLTNYNDDFNYQGTSPFTNGAGGDVWCKPTNTAPLNMPASNCLSGAENSAMTRAGTENESVLAVLDCFNWNVTDDWGGVVSGGNTSKFNLCSDPVECRANEDLCKNSLPRSVVPDFCTDHGANDVWVDSDPANETLFQNCEAVFSDPAAVEPDNGEPGPGDLDDGGPVCGSTRSADCGTQMYYPANHECNDNCSIISTSGRYQELLPDLTFDPATYVDVTYWETCNYELYEWVSDWQWVDNGSWVDNPDVPCPTPDEPDKMCDGGQTWVSNWELEDQGQMEWVPYTKNCPYDIEELDEANDCAVGDPDGFETALGRAISLAGGSCAQHGVEWQRGGFFDSDYTGPGVPIPRDEKRYVGFIEAVAEAATESVNQMDKLSFRQAFLDRRILELELIQDLMDFAADEFEEFLTGPAADLIQARIDYDEMDTGLPYHAVYGWQDDPPEDAPPDTVGQWHVVRVDARSPDRCDNQCSLDYQSSGNWPRVKTYTKDWGTSRCYELTDTDGRVKMRVTRYDEPLFYGSGGGGAAETREKSAVYFPTGKKIWDFRADLPLDDSGRPPPSAHNLGLTCAGSMVDDPPGLPAPYNIPPPTGKGDIYKGAYLLNNPYEDSNCWARSARLLTHGVSTETCAEYYFHEGLVSGMSVRFVDCPGEGAHSGLGRFMTTYRPPD